MLAAVNYYILKKIFTQKYTQNTIDKNGIQKNKQPTEKQGKRNRNKNDHRNETWWLLNARPLKRKREKRTETRNVMKVRIRAPTHIFDKRDRGWAILQKMLLEKFFRFTGLNMLKYSVLCDEIVF